MRAIARRIVAKESSKCRSGRALDRTRGTNPSRRGGKRPHTFADDERVAAEDDRDVMIPARKGATFVVVEPELAFELLVGAFGAPSFLDRASDVLLAHSSRKRRERELRRPALSFGPLDDEPQRLPILGRRAVVVSDNDATEAELREHRTARAVAPGQMPKAFSSDSKSEVRDGRCLGTASATSVDGPHLRRAVDANGDRTACGAACHGEAGERDGVQRCTGGGDRGGAGAAGAG